MSGGRAPTSRISKRRGHRRHLVDERALHPRSDALRSHRARTRTFSSARSSVARVRWTDVWMFSASATVRTSRQATATRPSRRRSSSFSTAARRVRQSPAALAPPGGRWMTPRSLWQLTPLLDWCSVSSRRSRSQTLSIFIETPAKSLITAHPTAYTQPGAVRARPPGS